MSYEDIDFATLKTVIATLPNTFRTKDVSEDTLMMKRHGPESQTRNYHADVGSAISAHRVDLMVKDQNRPGSHGTEWLKVGARGVQPDDAAEVATAGASGAELDDSALLQDLDIDVLRAVVSTLSAAFATRDVAIDVRTQAAHATVAGSESIDAFVERGLRLHANPLGLEEVRKGTPRGTVWRKRAPVVPPRSRAERRAAR